MKLTGEVRNRYFGFELLSFGVFFWLTNLLGVVGGSSFK